MSPDFLTPKEAAARLRVDREVVYGLIRSRQLAAVNVSSVGSSGRRPVWRISVAALVAFESRGGVSAQPPHPASTASRRSTASPRSASRPPQRRPPSIVGPRSRRK